MLSELELKTILDVLQEKNRMMDEIITYFVRRFVKEDTYRIACGLFVLLQDRLLSNHQRLVAYTVLFGIYKNDKSVGSTSTLIGPIFLESIEIAISPMEHFLIAQLISNLSFFYEILNISPTQLMKELIELTKRNPNIKLENRKAVQDKLLSQPSLREAFPNHSIEYSRLGIRPVVTFPDPHKHLSTSSNVVDGNPLRTKNETEAEWIMRNIMNPSDDNAEGFGDTWTDEEIREEVAAMEILLDDPHQIVKCPSSLRPRFVHLTPPMCQISEEELLLDELAAEAMMTEEASSMIIRGGTAATSEVEVVASREEMKDLLLKASNATLSAKQTQQLVSFIKFDPEFLLHCPLPPSTLLPALVQHNGSIATECIKQVCHFPNANEFFSVMMSMSISLPCIEAVKELATLANPPIEFIHTYIINCIAMCENDKDQYSQNRSVRLICALLKSLIIKNVASIKDLFAEIQTFCLTMSRSKDALQLFQTIKHLE